MVKTLSVVIFSLLLVGCAGGIKIKKEVQEVYVPLLYCPAPPKIERPVLPIETMTKEQSRNPGEVAKHYKATVKVLQGYAKELESALEQYNKTSETYDQLREKFKSEWKEGGAENILPQ